MTTSIVIVAIAITLPSEKRQVTTLVKAKISHLLGIPLTFVSSKTKTFVTLIHYTKQTAKSRYERNCTKFINIIKAQYESLVQRDEKW